MATKIASEIYLYKRYRKEQLQETISFRIVRNRGFVGKNTLKKLL
jgi:hypothetical protein